ncbi:hypothetical protein NC651_020802 [Populus alba x Populus x berolinensis]|nr:hypothetical protein NC651_020802 [Populus alba x Populus x berolinensis]
MILQGTCLDSRSIQSQEMLSSPIHLNQGPGLVQIVSTTESFLAGVAGNEVTLMFWVWN